ncbi:iron complex transport system substrate-binding protein [Dyadobacter jejuensis]|uniref:Iron complex transport system substrate-binding protein n=1 Tax=Dyadobacter jejuensis TaxID=1082580 RepID=A0A316AIK0_9BACT|nr:ABC transporter substrate-binding protein [Dyadobacter jejuensis]PWJ56700.1 iron complex transport system substrate-binding protein [Dyadobacter jejuensis]
MLKFIQTSLYLLCFMLGPLCSGAKPLRIVSVNGTLSEIVAGLGLTSQLVGVDITSTYPESLQKVPKVGHNRSLSAEGILSLNPDLIIYTNESMVSDRLLSQLKASGKKVVLFEQVYSKQGAIDLIRAVGKYFDRNAQAEKMVTTVENDLRRLVRPEKPQKLLFIYARGTATMMVAGTGTALEALFGLTGNINAVQGFSNFKPLTAEALVMANPDVLVLFDSGLESLDGPQGLLKVPGVMATNAGKNKKIVSMDGQLLTSYGPRLGKAAIELAQKIK